MPDKEKQSKYQKMNNLTGQDEFVNTYFMMLLNTLGPMSKEKVEEEWDKFNSIFQPMAGLVTKKCSIFNALKNSSSFVVVDDLLCIKESPHKGANFQENYTGEIKKMEELSEVSQPAATYQEPLEPPSLLNPSKQPEPSKISEPLKESNSIVQLPPGIDLAPSKAIGNQKDWAKENAVLDSEISEIEKELRLTNLFDRIPKDNNNSSELSNTKLLDSPGKDQSKVDKNTSQNMPHTFNMPFSLFDGSTSENKIPFIAPVNHQKVTGIPLKKSSESLPVMHHPDGFFVVPPPIRPPTQPLPPPQPLQPPPVIAPLMPSPIRWPIEGLQPLKHIPYENPELFKPMMVFPTHSGLNPCSIHPYQFQNRKDISIQTDEKWEVNGTSGDETWVQHMQLAVNELMKKNRDLMKSKEVLIKTHENEVEAIKNQMRTLRHSYEQYIESLKENINNNDEDRRRAMALEQRMKLQEQILNSTKEELRNKDFDLLEAKRLLGRTILERIESESCKQVTRLVTALASLPCNSKDAETVGQAMAKWELTGDNAGKAKSEFSAACMRHQAKLIDCYGSDTLNDLVIPVVEEPIGPCPLDNLTLRLLTEKENSTMESARTAMPAPIGIPAFRNRSATVSTNMPSIAGPLGFPAVAPVPLPSVSLGARPRTPGDASLRRWPSSHSIQGSTHSSVGGTSRTLSNFQKLLIELKRCYPSRSDNDLYTAIKLTRRKNKNTLSGLTIEKIVGMVSKVLEWWPEPMDGAMGLDKFMGWAADVAPADETFCSISKGPPQGSAWMPNNSSPRKEGDKEDCCICLQGMSEPKTDLICSHSFHTQCIRKWLSKDSVCPICRKFTRMPDEFPKLK